ncbi:Lipase [Zea mays]|uniref:Lipase n=3 Tax=Zea mays TaxID=4577 RepID=K7TUH0_MAIZE|nr:lipase precursor [Zea mays]AQK48686.1 Lipase [Zea mays]PWZ26390.1 Lipase [Zea mays]
MAWLRRTETLVLLLVVLLASASTSAAAAAAGEEEERVIRLKHSDGGYSYNHTLAHILVEYASAVYTSDLTSLFSWTCPRCKGHTKGFEVIEIIVDVENCLQAFVGVAPDPRSIIIAFRGTQQHSVSNWIEDLFWKQLDVTYPGMPDAMVHHGFYSAYYNTTLRYEILKSIKWARKTYGNLPINVVGHSMGGALASFCALDLSVKFGSQEVELMTFGQPRIGNPAFAVYFGEQVPRTIRVTHQNDIVPHLPPYYYYLGEWTYHHFAREVWLHESIDGNVVTRNETVCDDSGEDPTCSRSVYGMSVADHLEYYDVTLHADSRGTCQFVIGAANQVYNYVREVDGSIILSRYPQEPQALESM